MDDILELSDSIERIAAYLLASNQSCKTSGIIEAIKADMKLQLKEKDEIGALRTLEKVAQLIKLKEEAEK